MKLCYRKTTSIFLKSILVLFFLLGSITESFAGEIDSIMSGVGTIILIVGFFICAGVISPIFIFIKKAKPRFLTFTSINAFIFLMIWLNTTSQDFFILDRIYIFNLQLFLQIIGSIWMLFIYLDEEKPKRIEVDEEILDEEI